MALRKGPAIRAEWVDAWLKRGSLQAAFVGGSRILLVTSDCQPQKTYYREKEGEIEKRRRRYWLAKGTLLVTHWVCLDNGYVDPVLDIAVGNLLDEELKKRGLYRVKQGVRKGELLLLIFMHLEDLLHTQRQQWHIAAGYEKVLPRISKDLEKVEADLFGWIDLMTLPGSIMKPEDARLLDWRNLLALRKEEIEQILSHIRTREELIEGLLNALRKEIRLARESLENTLSSRPVKKMLVGTVTTKERQGLCAHLVEIYRHLGQIKTVKPVIWPLNLAQNCLLCAIGSLYVGEAARFGRQMRLAVANLDKASVSLQQPPAEKEGIPEQKAA